MGTPAETPDGPLSGFTVGITAARRNEELTSLLERRGAKVVSAPSIRIVPLPDDRQLLEATRACLHRPLDLAVATTGVGFRGWMEAAEGWGLAGPLHDQLAAARLIARGPKATGAIRAAGLSEEWSPASESSVDVLSHLLQAPLAGKRIAVQLHGEPQLDFCGALRDAGAEVLEVPVYRWVLPEDIVPLRRLVDLVVTGAIDGVAFTSAPAAAAMLRFAAEEGHGRALVAALRSGSVVAACVGPVCSLPLERVGVSCLIPERARLGALVRVIADQLPAMLSRELVVRERIVELRGRSVTYDGTPVTLTPGPLAVLRALLATPGAVVGRPALLAALPGDSDDGHAVEAAIGRLRRAFGDPGVVQTVVKRGYRLDCATA